MRREEVRPEARHMVFEEAIFVRSWGGDGEDANGDQEKVCEEKSFSKDSAKNEEANEE
jgi:hypothetical protein